MYGYQDLTPNAKENKRRKQQEYQAALDRDMGKGDAGQQQQQQRLFPDLNPKYKPNGASPKRAKARMSNMENSFDAEMIIEKLNQFEQYMHFNDRRLQEIEVNLNKAQAKTEYRDHSADRPLRSGIDLDSKENRKIKLRVDELQSILASEIKSRNISERELEQRIISARENLNQLDGGSGNTNMSGLVTRVTELSDMINRTNTNIQNETMERIELQKQLDAITSHDKNLDGRLKAIVADLEKEKFLNKVAADERKRLIEMTRDAEASIAAYRERLTEADSKHLVSEKDSRNHMEYLEQKLAEQSEAFNSLIKEKSASMQQTAMSLQVSQDKAFQGIADQMRGFEKKLSVMEKNWQLAISESLRSLHTDLRTEKENTMSSQQEMKEVLSAEITSRRKAVAKTNANVDKILSRNEILNEDLRQTKVKIDDNMQYFNTNLCKLAAGFSDQLIALQEVAKAAVRTLQIDQVALTAQLKNSISENKQLHKVLENQVSDCKAKTFSLESAFKTETENLRCCVTLLDGRLEEKSGEFIRRISDESKQRESNIRQLSIELRAAIESSIERTEALIRDCEIKLSKEVSSRSASILESEKKILDVLEKKILDVLEKHGQALEDKLSSMHEVIQQEISYAISLENQMMSQNNQKLNKLFQEKIELMEKSTKDLINAEATERSAETMKSEKKILDILEKHGQSLEDKLSSMHEVIQQDISYATSLEYQIRSRNNQKMNKLFQEKIESLEGLTKDLINAEAAERSADILKSQEILRLRQERSLALEVDRILGHQNEITESIDSKFEMRDLAAKQTKNRLERKMAREAKLLCETDENLRSLMSMETKEAEKLVGAMKDRNQSLSYDLLEVKDDLKKIRAEVLSIGERKDIALKTAELTVDSETALRLYVDNAIQIIDNKIDQKFKSEDGILQKSLQDLEESLSLKIHETEKHQQFLEQKLITDLKHNNKLFSDDVRVDMENNSAEVLREGENEEAVTKTAVSRGSSLCEVEASLREHVSSVARGLEDKFQNETQQLLTDQKKLQEELNELRIICSPVRLATEDLNTISSSAGNKDVNMLEKEINAQVSVTTELRLSLEKCVQDILVISKSHDLIYKQLTNEFEERIVDNNKLRSEINDLGARCSIERIINTIIVADDRALSPTVAKVNSNNLHKNNERLLVASQNSDMLEKLEKELNASKVRTVALEKSFEILKKEVLQLGKTFEKLDDEILELVEKREISIRNEIKEINEKQFAQLVAGMESLEACLEKQDSRLTSEIDKLEASMALDRINNSVKTPPAVQQVETNVQNHTSALISKLETELRNYATLTSQLQKSVDESQKEIKAISKKCVDQILVLQQSVANSGDHMTAIENSVKDLELEFTSLSRKGSVENSPQKRDPSSDANDEAEDNPANWVANVDQDTGGTYYYNMVTDETQWEIPECLGKKKTTLKERVRVIQTRQKELEDLLQSYDIPVVLNAIHDLRGDLDENIEEVHALHNMIYNGNANNN